MRANEGKSSRRRGREGKRNSEEEDRDRDFMKLKIFRTMINPVSSKQGKDI
jgi:hypothetical protein